MLKFLKPVLLLKMLMTLFPMTPKDQRGDVRLARSQLQVLVQRRGSRDCHNQPINVKDVANVLAKHTQLWSVHNVPQTFSFLKLQLLPLAERYPKCIFVKLSFSPFVFQYFNFLSFCPLVHLSFRSFVLLSFCQFFHMSICPSVHSSSSACLYEICVKITMFQ